MKSKKRIELVRNLREELNLPIPILLDTKGPEIRTGDFKEGKAKLETGQLFTLTPKEVEGTEHICHISYSNFVDDITLGTRILINDGLIEMRVVKISGRDIECEVLNGGPVSNHKSVNVPDVNLTMDYMSKKVILL